MTVIQKMVYNWHKCSLFLYNIILSEVMFLPYKYYLEMTYKTVMKEKLFCKGGGSDGGRK